MSVEAIDLKVVLDHFKNHDVSGQGLISRSDLSLALELLGCADVNQMIEAAGLSKKDEVSYKEFLEWLMMGSIDSRRKADALANCSTDTGLELANISKSLKRIASSVAASDLAASAELLRHAATLQVMSGQPSSECPDQSPNRVASSPGGKRWGSKRHCNTHGFREQAAMVVQQTGCPGAPVDDLVEVNINDLKNKSAMSCWRSCYGLRLFRSETVTKALRLICSAPVPGLGETSYLDVFHTLTHSGWEHHIFLFGGLVRDILRRKVGNDIDITFSAPAMELEEICHQHGFKCKLEGDYILIGDESGAEYLEGMVITHNGITPPENSDFSMNWVFYDFCNDVIIDKTGLAISAILANRCEIPCPRSTWDTWVRIGGSRILFRYYKFLIRGYAYNREEMAYIATRLLAFWSQDAEETVEIGRDTLSSLLSCTDTGKIESLRQLVFTSFDLVASEQTPQFLRRQSTAGSFLSAREPRAQSGCQFFSASCWWQRGWMLMLRLGS
mmetsp:Transcript_3239/g.5242  ORF Transcript_3239/g.5242 Transcript_3239/m.5242 type:complete len:501 (+) Transcript_3239:51-1553(+)